MRNVWESCLLSCTVLCVDHTARVWGERWHLSAVLMYHNYEACQPQPCDCCHCGARRVGEGVLLTINGIFQGPFFGVPDNVWVLDASPILDTPTVKFVLSLLVWFHLPNLVLPGGGVEWIRLRRVSAAPTADATADAAPTRAPAYTRGAPCMGVAWGATTLRARTEGAAGRSWGSGPGGPQVGQEC